MLGAGRSYAELIAESLSMSVLHVYNRIVFAGDKRNRTNMPKKNLNLKEFLSKPPNKTVCVMIPLGYEMAQAKRRQHCSLGLKSS